MSAGIDPLNMENSGLLRRSGSIRRLPRAARDIPPLGPFGKDVARTLRCWALSGLAALSAGAASALPSAPSLKPRPTIVSAVVSAADAAALRSGLDAAEARRWTDARSHLARLGDPRAKDLLRWRIVTDGDSGTGYGDLAAAAEHFAAWPDLARIQEQMELRIGVSSLSAEERIAALTTMGPRTAEGVLTLADALAEQGRDAERGRLIRDTWRTRPLPAAAAADIERRHGSVLSPADHAARADMLLWRSSVSQASALLGRTDEDQRRVLQARIALMQNRKGAEASAAELPAALRSDPGLLFERARLAERRGQLSAEADILLEIRGDLTAPAGREAVWREKQATARRLLREGDVATAYRLCLDHGLTGGESFLDAEWLAGWIALRKQSDPQRALDHFRRLTAIAQTPISQGRAWYWLGRALAAGGERDEARAAYERAARHPFVFYGQLAAEALAAESDRSASIGFAAIESPAAAQRQAFAERPDVAAAILLAESGRLALFERFSNHIDDRLQTAVDHQMLFDIGAGFLEMRAAVRGGKAGLARGLVAPDAVFPLYELPASPRTGSAEPALVLALARQESEFNHRAVSSADARGMMQMIPRYAQAEAKLVGLPFRQSWLTDDPAYNFRLGRGFLDDLVDDYGGSYVLATAAYNAGPSRARQWIRDFGDPRAGADPVDWIESIPFSETRNYVQRVLENTQVYRHRLSGTAVPIRLTADLARGRPN
jgi:soluble lytic murein transglycosylase